MKWRLPGLSCEALARARLDAACSGELGRDPGILLVLGDLGIAGGIDRAVAIGGTTAAEQRIALAAELDIEQAGRCRAGIEMLHEAHAGCREQQAAAPIDAFRFAVARAADARIAGAGDGQEMRALHLPARAPVA